MKKISIFILTILVTISALWAYTNVSAQSAIFQNVRLSSNTVKEFEKIEWTFDLNKEYPNPYYYYDPTDTPQNNPSNHSWFGVDGVSVDVVISSPDGTQSTLPAFYFEDYAIKKVGDVSVEGRKGPPVWKARFAPQQVGTHQWYLTLSDKSGSYRYPALGTNSFNVTAGNSRGFVTVSKQDPRFLAFSKTGEAFIGSGSSAGVWPGQSLSFSYQDTFKTMQDNGINLLRIWDQSDFALSVEGANPVWVSGTTMNGDATGVNIGAENAKEGIRSANPSSSTWYQRLVVSQPNTPHTLRAWVRGGAIVSLRSVSSNATLGNTLAQTQPQSANVWTQVQLDYTPTSDLIAVQLSGNGSVDVVEFGPKNGGSISYNILSDHSFERHFSKDNPGNDPNTNSNLPRPLGNYFNQWSSIHLDKIIEDAQLYQVYLQLCSCSGPWFTWPKNPEAPDEASYSDAWWLKSWQRNFRYRVARWGYSTSVLAWERKNEYGHVTPGTPVYEFYKKYSDFQKVTDPYRHLRTTSQGSQTFSPAFWSSDSFDIANYHDYAMSSRYPVQLHGDIANFIYRFSWCLREYNSCNDSALGIGDGTKWSGGHKPFIWGEIGAGLTDWNSPSSTLVSQGEGGSRYIHNVGWAGLFSPIGTTPLDWTLLESADNVARQAYYNSRKALTAFFKGVKYDALRFNFIATSTDQPSWVNQATISSNQPKLRVYGMTSQDKLQTYLWVQNRDNTWVRASTPTTPVSGTVSIPNISNGTYRVEFWNTRTGQITTTQNLTASNNSISLNINSLSNDLAIKVLHASTLVDQPPQTTPSPTITPQVNIGNGDVDGNGQVNTQDILALASVWGQGIGGAQDQYPDGVVNSLDATVVLAAMRTVATPAPTIAPTVAPTATSTPTATPVATSNPTTAPLPSAGTPTSSNTWYQHAANAQRTSYVSSEVPSPWRWKWAWNGPTSSGAIVGGKTGLPRNVQPVIGDGRVFVASGSNGVVALNRNDGSVVWTRSPGGSINSTVAYDPATQAVFAYSSNGTLYKLNSADGAVMGSFASGSGSNLPLPPAVVGSRVYLSSNTRLYALDTSNLSEVWSYQAGSQAVTPPAYSASRDRIIFGTQDLFIHAVQASNGQQAWRTKPSPRPASSPYELSYGWPVVSDANGLVLVKMRLDWNTMWTWNPWPTTNSAMRSNLQSNPSQQALYALNLDNGSVPFISNIGHGGYGDNDFMPMGPQPVVKSIGGTEVAYMVIRGTTYHDGRWDSNFGELMLNNSVSGYQAGDVRFIQYTNDERSYLLTDEQPNLAMAGNHLFGGHWMAGLALQVQDRSPNRGAFNSRITSTTLPHITTSASNCGLSASKYCANGLVQDGDPRTFPAGFYIYYNQGTVYDRYWGAYASYVIGDGLVLFRSNDGAIVALESGSPAASTNTPLAPAVGGAQSYQNQTPKTISVSQARQHAGQYVQIQDTVKYSVNGGKKHVLSFASHHLGSLKIIIKQQDWDSFPAHPQTIFPTGTTINAKGYLGWYQGDPTIYIDHPDQISVVR